MKQLMLGNEAVARGLYEAGCRFLSSYPGTPSTEISEAAAKYDEIYAEWAPNEKVAMEAAIGASIGGARSFCAMKHVGLNVAADPLFTVSYTGVNAGMVIAVADDPGMHSSQNEQDSRHHAIASKIPMLEPSDSAECLEFTKLAYDLSEKFDTPVLLRTATRVAHSQSLVQLNERVDKGLLPYEKNPAKYVMMPGNAIRRHPFVEERMEAAREWSETSGINRVELGEDRSVGYITSGVCYQYLREGAPDASILKIGMTNPLPVKLIRDFAAKVGKLIVVEELDPIIENHVRALGIKVDGGKDLFGLLGELSQNKILKALGKATPDAVDFGEAVPPRPPILCPGCPHRGIFYTLSKLGVFVSGDIGCYTLGALAPLNALDTTVCMGASISGLHGFNTARGPESAKKSVAVIGDSTFMHSGITGLVNIIYNEGESTVIILDNSITGMTGHQENPTTGKNLKGQPAPAISLEKLCEAVGVKNVRVCDPYAMAEMKAVIQEELEKSEPSVIISRRPCVLLPGVKTAPALKIDKEKCKSCRLCMTIGCPAISFIDKKAQIDGTLCVGCDLCVQMCSFGAIGGNEK
ncbi:MAG: indolepyruvate ferredoxin oxidoreductase subunit alpha [Oscillospiraceae bacterium]|jgi:indolepyruvate ferredoxin oxidoreductase alpha subunit|nr:indolepyruvate ferredoxin oxidoreductase subunit alpha [Oscillospiraceae bacterium]